MAEKHKRRAFMIAATSAVLYLLAACSGLSTQQETATNDAITALRKLEAATQVKTDYTQYSQLVIEAKARVNKAEAVLPDGELKVELHNAMDAYVDAGTMWSQMLHGEIYHDIEREPGKTLSPKYNLDLGGSGWATTEYTEALERLRNPSYESAYRKYILQKIWSVAKAHLDRAAALIEH